MISPNTRATFGCDFLNHLTFLLIHFPDALKTNIPAETLNSICESLVNSPGPFLIHGLTWCQIIERLFALGAQIKDPEAYARGLINREDFSINLAIQYLPTGLLADMHLGKILSEEQEHRPPLFVSWVTCGRTKVWRTALEHLLPGLTDAALTQALVTLYAQLVMPASQSSQKRWLRNFGQIWCTLNQRQQQAVAQAIQTTAAAPDGNPWLPPQSLQTILRTSAQERFVQATLDRFAQALRQGQPLPRSVVGSLHTMPVDIEPWPPFDILQAIFADGTIDLAAGQRVAYTHLCRLADGPGKQLFEFFEQVAELGFPGLCQDLLHLCLYNPKLAAKFQRFFPSCIPYDQCQSSDQWHLFAPLLLGAFEQQPRFSPDLGTGFTTAIETFVASHKQALAAGHPPPDCLPAPDRANNISGSTILFAPEPNRQTVYHLRLRKKEENPEDLLRELPALKYLKQQQESGQLRLTSQLAVPVDVFYLPNFPQWLQQSGLSQEQQAQLNDHVQIDQHGNALAYLYSTESTQGRYQHPVHERDSSFGYHLDKALATLGTAATDMGRLWRRGICFDHGLPLHQPSPWHKEWSLVAPHLQTCRGIVDWNGVATDHPHIAPQPSVLRDFSASHSFQDLVRGNKDDQPLARVTINSVGRTLLALELLLAKTMEPEIRKAAQNPDSEQAKTTLQQIEDSLKQLYNNFAREAFGSTIAEELIARMTANPGTGAPAIVGQAAREMIYYLETSDAPRYAQHMLEQSVCPLYRHLNARLPCPEGLTPQGVRGVSNQRSVTLIDKKHTFPLVQNTHMKYLLMMLVAALAHRTDRPKEHFP